MSSVSRKVANVAKGYKTKDGAGVRYNKGNKGLLKPGMVQVMNAARGIIHSEMPKQVEGKMFGFQFWLNLAAVDKMSDPWYKDIPAEEIPEVITNDNTAHSL
ncbi:hypothetical protein ACTFIW_000076 [Dictyostelium discoideum]